MDSYVNMYFTENVIDCCWLIKLKNSYFTFSVMQIEAMNISTVLSCNNTFSLIDVLLYIVSCYSLRYFHHNKIKTLNSFYYLLVLVLSINQQCTLITSTFIAIYHL